MRTKGTASELERRRRLAVDRVTQGWKPAEVAAFLGIHLRTVYRWLAQHRADPCHGLQAQPPPGRTPKLSRAQEDIVLSWFGRKPTAFGFPTDLWTADRVATLIARTFGVRFNARYLSAWLARRRIRPLKPQKQPRERDPAKVQAWLAGTWPTLRAQVAAGAPLTLIDESGLLLLPLVRRSLAPKGHPALLTYRAKHREKVSLIAGLTVQAGQPLRLFFRTYPQDYVNNVKAAEFVRTVLQEVGSESVVLWDGGPMHKGDPIRALQREYPGVQIERLPPYSPQMNPVEFLWSLLKYGRLCNYTPHSAVELDETARQHLAEIQLTPDLLQAFWDHCELPLNELALAS